MKSHSKASRQELIVLLLDAVAKVARAAKTLDAEQWKAPACGQWDCHQLARHLLSQIRYSHHNLDRAISGDASMPYPADRIDYENRVALEFLANTSGPDAIADFVGTAGRFANRIGDHWDLNVGFPGGSSTMADNCALAALEYHIHAWDMANVAGTPLEPARVRQLFDAVGNAYASQVTGKERLRIKATFAWRRRRQPWEYLLELSGRHPGQKTTNESPMGSTIDLRGDAELPLPSTQTRAGVSSD